VLPEDGKLVPKHVGDTRLISTYLILCMWWVQSIEDIALAPLLHTSRLSVLYFKTQSMSGYVAWNEGMIGG